MRTVPLMLACNLSERVAGRSLNHGVKLRMILRLSFTLQISLLDYHIVIRSLIHFMNGCLFLMKTLKLLLVHIHLRTIAVNENFAEFLRYLSSGSRCLNHILLNPICQTDEGRGTITC